MDETFGDGGCLCGGVRFRVTGEPARVGICHCLDCRKAHGAAFNSYAIFNAAQVELRGATTAFVRPGGGNYLERFCATCGSRVFAQDANDPEGGEVEVPIGAFDTTGRYTPQYELWVHRREPWVAALPVPQYEGNRPDAQVDGIPAYPELTVLRSAAFSDGPRGGNPAGVVIADAFPSDARMQAIAAEVGYSETAFAIPEGEGWRVRYFSPESEVPFCGHATIALGAALAERAGEGAFALTLNEARIQVEAHREADLMLAALQSPPTRSHVAPPAIVDEVLALFGLAPEQIDPRIAPAVVHGGADHFALVLRERADLAAMRYDLDAGRALMQREGWVTILLAWIEDEQHFHTRIAFASGGVYEDPATGAASAAFAGYLRDIEWPHGGAIAIAQGEDMGSPSRIRAEIGPEPGASIRVSGTVRPIPG
jgi:PhzF family phenazine biosynthesis protein